MTKKSPPNWPQTSTVNEQSLKILHPKIEINVLKLCKQGYTMYDNGEIKSALRKFYSAWTLLPKPQTQWQEAAWVLTALGDAYFTKGDYKNGQQALLSALHCPAGSGNPVIHFRLGQCLFELGNLDDARIQFNKAIDHGGKKLLEQANQDYWALVTNLQDK